MAAVQAIRPRRGRRGAMPASVPRRQRQASALDRIDLNILAALQRDGRMSKTALARAVGLSPSACVARVRRLEVAKLILSYHALVDLKALAGLHTFYTEVTLRSHRGADFARFEQTVRKVESIVECYALGGGIDYLLKVVCPDVDHYQALIDRLLEEEIGVDRYFTYIVTKPVKSLLQLPVAALDVAREG